MVGSVHRRAALGVASALALATVVLGGGADARADTGAGVTTGPAGSDLVSDQQNGVSTDPLPSPAGDTPLSPRQWSQPRAPLSGSPNRWSSDSRNRLSTAPPRNQRSGSHRRFPESFTGSATPSFAGAPELLAGPNRSHR